MKPINTNAQFFTDLENASGSGVNKGWYNLITSIHELKLWKLGARMHSNQRLMDYKTYFGITGDASKLLDVLEQIKKDIKQQNA
jgi:hypothetical protein